MFTSQAVLFLLQLSPVLSASLRPEARANAGGQQQIIVSEPATEGFKCDLPPVRAPPADDGLPSSDIFASDAALKKQVERHSAVVQVPSVCYDDLSDNFDEDERWLPFYDLHEVLADLFPLVHSRAKVEKINRFGLVYTFAGSNSSLKPILLAAHQDVVPVADPSTWTYPPFSAHYDGTYLWGRGASDDKNSLVALMSALETLLSTASWTPHRTIILAFGFDEECSGRRGAGSIAKHLESVWGNGSVAMILDEGGMGLQLLDDTLYALPAVLEKGHVDIKFVLYINGGHSSIPYPHTGIGVISEIVVALESHPYEPRLTKSSPLYNHLVCQARYSPDAAPKITELLKHDDLEALAQELVSIDRPTQFRLQTSQAVDIIHGGVKINAMPEVITLQVNYRVAPHNSIPEIQKNVIKYIQPIVEKYSLVVEAFEGDQEFWDFANEDLSDLIPSGGAVMDDVRPMYEVSYNGTLVLSASQKTAVAPTSPTVGSPIWDAFSGVIQHSFGFPGGKVVPASELMTGNTDTRHYLNLSKNVYRWTPTRQGYTFNAHTVDEHINMKAHMEALTFYYDLIRVFDVEEDF